MKFRGRHIFFRIWPFLFAIIIFASVKFGTGHPGLVEKYYSEGLYPLIAETLSSLSRFIPFSLWDLFWILFVIVLLSGLFLVAFKKLKLSSFLLRLFQTLAIIYSIFYLSWGFNYFRPKIENRVGWLKPLPDESFFRQILDSLIVNTNRSHTSIFSTEYKAVDSLVEESYKENAKALRIDYPNGSRTPKIMILSSLFAKSGVSGYFGPFFNEIHLNGYLLPMEYPFVLAHEKAHQFGITDESEANFAAYMVCSTSPDRRLEYSGNMQILLYFLSDAHKIKDYKDYVGRIDSLVIKDIQKQRQHWKALENKTLDHVQTAANNAYLKSNRIEEGIKNYNKVVSLVITWFYTRKEHQPGTN